MLILDRAVVNEIARDGTRGHDGDLTIEVHHGFKNGFTAADGLPRGIENSSALRRSILALAVISEIGGLENRGEADLGLQRQRNSAGSPRARKA